MNYQQDYIMLYIIIYSVPHEKAKTSLRDCVYCGSMRQQSLKGVRSGPSICAQGVRVQVQRVGLAPFQHAKCKVQHSGFWEASPPVKWQHRWQECACLWSSIDLCIHGDNVIAFQLTIEWTFNLCNKWQFLTKQQAFGIQEGHKQHKMKCTQLYLTKYCSSTIDLYRAFKTYRTSKFDISQTSTMS